MTRNKNDQIDSSASDWGMTAEHPKGMRLVYFVAPSTSEKKVKNTIVLEFNVAACWKVEDICFEFDRALIRLDAVGAFKELGKLWNREIQLNKTPKTALFGHADPVGKDRYNKKLSEDRAKAVYGILTRKVAVWRDIFDKAEEIKELQNHLFALGYYSGNVDGLFNADTENAVKEYMDDLSPDLKLEDKDFLGEGKAAYQGCSEFNPLRMFSADQNKELSKKENHEERNEENQPNRRVVAYIWRIDKKNAPKQWPCPKAPDIAGCEKRFWSPNISKKRRAFQQKGREWDYSGKGGTSTPFDSRWNYEKTRDTFVCRFYERIANVSPCELVKPFVRQEKWQITLSGVEVFDNLVAEAHRDVCKILHRMYPPQHKNRTNLHLDFGIKAKYTLVIDFTIAKKQDGSWHFLEGVIKKASVYGEEVIHPAFSAYYAKPGAHPDSTVSWKGEQYRVELLRKGGISRLNNEKVSIVFGDKPEIQRLYKPDARPLEIYGWSPQMARSQLRSRGLIFDYHGFHYDMRPGRNVDEYQQVPHVKMKLPSFQACNAIVRDKVTSDYVLSMADAQFHHYLNDLEHLIPLKDGEKFVFNHVSDNFVHRPKYRDTPFFYATYEYSVKRV
jgi:hypothetical protein